MKFMVDSTDGRNGASLWQSTNLHRNGGTMYAVLNIFDPMPGRVGRVLSRHRSYRAACAAQVRYEDQLKERMNPAPVCFFPFAVMREVRRTKVGRWVSDQVDVRWSTEAECEA